MEQENQLKLPFLDLLIQRLEDGSLKFSVFRKPTALANYLRFDSYNPTCHKRAVVKSLSDRAKRVCNSSDILIENE